VNNPFHDVPPSPHHIITHTKLRPAHRSVDTLRYSPPTIQFMPFRRLCNTLDPIIHFAPQYGPHTLRYSPTTIQFTPPTLSALHHYPHYSSPHSTVQTHSGILHQQSSSHLPPYLHYIITHTTLRPTHRSVHTYSGILHQQSSSHLPPYLHYIITHTTLRPTVRSTHSGILHQQSSSQPPTLPAPHHYPNYPRPTHLLVRAHSAILQQYPIHFAAHGASNVNSIFRYTADWAPICRRTSSISNSDFSSRTGLLTAGIEGGFSLPSITFPSSPLSLSEDSYHLQPHCVPRGDFSVNVICLCSIRVRMGCCRYSIE
jgi:hypothetical protein